MSKEVKKETIALIGGTGNLGFGLALRWAYAGLPVLIGSRDEKKAQEAAKKAGEKLQTWVRGGAAAKFSVTGFENAQAAAQATVVVLAVPFPAQIGILKSIRGALKDSILVDATVPLAVTLGGRATRMVGVWQGSAAEQARELVPANIPVLSAFHHLSAETLQDPSWQLDCDVLVCGDNDEAKPRLCALVKLIPGLQPIDAGPLEMARFIESFTALLISLNKRHKVRDCGIRITGLNPPL